MKVPAALYEDIQKALIEVLPLNQEVGWADIVKGVSARVTIKNWLIVRGALQGLPNTKRTASIHEEKYIRKS